MQGPEEVSRGRVPLADDIWSRASQLCLERLEEQVVGQTKGCDKASSIRSNEDVASMICSCVTIQEQVGRDGFVQQISEIFDIEGCPMAGGIGREQTCMPRLAGDRPKIAALQEEILAWRGAGPA